jgi:archaeosine-15-forming tRNA-guanine transglycosylase
VDTTRRENKGGERMPRHKVTLSSNSNNFILRYNKNFLTLWIRLEERIRGGERRPRHKVTLSSNSNKFFHSLNIFIPTVINFSIL